jgi:GT2 family glycosyltransferase
LNKKVAILLVLFNEEKHIARLAGSIIDQSYKDISVYVFDNNSTDSSVQLLFNYLPDAKVIRSDENLGFAKGNNIIAAEAIKNNEDLLFILNTDMELECSCIKNLVGIFDERSDVKGAGPIVYIGTDEGRTKNIQCYADESNFIFGLSKTLYKGADISTEELPDKLYVNSLHGGSFMISSSVVSETGLFNEDNFMYNDEIDLAYRLSKVKGKLIVTKNAESWHFHDWNKKNKSGYYLQYYYINRNRFLFFYRYNKYLSFIPVILSEALLFPLKIKWAVKTSGLKLLKYYYLGYWHGLLNKKGKAKIEFK